MNCRDATDIMDMMLFEEVAMDGDLRKHIDNCASCRQLYMDTLRSREVLDLVRRSEPALRNPEKMTHGIMAGIGKNRQKPPVVPLLLQRLLAAASVALFLLFGYEQYRVVEKITALETHFTWVTTVPRYTDQLRLASTIYISTAGIPLAEIERRLTAGKVTTLRYLSIFNKHHAQRDIK